MIETRIESFSDENVVRQVIDTALAVMRTVLEPLGLQVERGKAKFLPEEITVQIKFRVQGEAGMPAIFPRNAARVGLPSDCWGKTMSIRGNVRTIVDIKPRNRKYPVIMKAPDGKRYKCSVSEVRLHLQNAR